MFKLVWTRGFLTGGDEQLQEQYIKGIKAVEKKIISISFVLFPFWSWSLDWHSGTGELDPGFFFLPGLFGMEVIGFFETLCISFLM